MNRIEEAIYNLHFMNNKSNSNCTLNHIHPLVKLIITILYILLLMGIDKYNLNTTLAMGIYLIVISIFFDLSIKKCFKNLKLLFIMLIVMGIANPILDRDIVTQIGVIPITSGMISMATLVLKGFFALISSYFLAVTTSMEKICYALKLLHIPNILITIFILIYRYIIVFLKEAERIWTAYHMRAPEQKGVHFRAWGSMIGSLMIRSIDKAQAVYESMELRGFSPETLYLEKQRLDKKSILYIIAGILLILFIRFVPIFELMGNCFI